MARKFPGHRRPWRRASVGRVTAAFSSTVSTESAIVPIAFHSSSGAEERAAFADAAIRCSIAEFGFGKGADGGSMGGGDRRGSAPRATSAPMMAPADVPRIRSAFRRSSPVSRKPAIKPQCIARPSKAPPPRTSARDGRTPTVWGVSFTRDSHGIAGLRSMSRRSAPSPGTMIRDGSKVICFEGGAPREIRTPGLLIRSQSLYPAELWAHNGWDSLRITRALSESNELHPWRDSL